MTSFKVWEGPSKFNNQQISLIFTGFKSKSQNRKTGHMIQSWILPNINPTLAIKNEQDTCVCGDCPLRPHKNNFKNSCYVGRLAFQAPRAVWAGSINKNIQLHECLEELSNNNYHIRYGSYGDIAMIPKEIFQQIHSTIKTNKKSHTAYTHQYKHAFAYWVRKYAMASVETIWDAELFQALGWRTFRITNKPEQTQNEIICPNYTKGLQCIDCCLCDGKKSLNDNRKNITIPRH